jgi:hypothetical protein
MHHHAQCCQGDKEGGIQILLGDYDCNLKNGLEEIGKEALEWGMSLQCLVIPLAAKMIKDHAFYWGSNLTQVKFCNEIEEFMSSKAIREWWWNKGLHKKTVSTYCFLVRCSVLEHLLSPALIKQVNIHNMLGCIPANILRV